MKLSLFWVFIFAITIIAFRTSEASCGGTYHVTSYELDKDTIAIFSVKNPENSWLSDPYSNYPNIFEVTIDEVFKGDIEAGQKKKIIREKGPLSSTSPYIFVHKKNLFLIKKVTEEDNYVLLDDFKYSYLCNSWPSKDDLRDYFLDKNIISRVGSFLVYFFELNKPLSVSIFMLLEWISQFFLILFAVVFLFKDLRKRNFKRPS